MLTSAHSQTSPRSEDPSRTKRLPIFVGSTPDLLQTSAFTEFLTLPTYCCDLSAQNVYTSLFVLCRRSDTFRMYSSGSMARIPGREYVNGAKVRGQCLRNVFLGFYGLHYFVFGHDVDMIGFDAYNFL